MHGVDRSGEGGGAERACQLNILVVHTIGELAPCPVEAQLVGLADREAVDGLLQRPGEAGIAVEADERSAVRGVAGEVDVEELAILGEAGVRVGGLVVREAEEIEVVGPLVWGRVRGRPARQIAAVYVFVVDLPAAEGSGAEGAKSARRR